MSAENIVLFGTLAYAAGMLALAGWYLAPYLLP